MVTSSLFVSSVIGDIYTLTIVYGALMGVGMGMVYLPSMLSVNMYFESKRALAVGLVTSGSSAGFFILAPAIEYVMRHYGLQVSLQVMGSLTALVALLGMALKPPPRVSVIQEETSSGGRRSSLSIDSEDIKQKQSI